MLMYLIDHNNNYGKHKEVYHKDGSNDNITDSESLKFKEMNKNICNNRCK